MQDFDYQEHAEKTHEFVVTSFWATAGYIVLSLIWALIDYLRS